MAAISIITPFTNDSIDEVILSLQDSAKKVFQYNQTKRNTDKCQFLFSKNDETQLEAGDSLVKKTTEKPLAVKIDNKLSFDEQVGSIC